MIRNYFAQNVLRKKKCNISQSVNYRNKCLIFSNFALFSHPISVLKIIVETKRVYFVLITVLNIKKIDITKVIGSQNVKNSQKSLYYPKSMHTHCSITFFLKLVKNK